MVAYRLISEDSLLRSRSFCPSCKKNIAWYDLFPLLSWLILKGKCRACSAQISWLYFFIEALTTLVLFALAVLNQPHYAIAYFMFFSALIITIRTDLEHMLISRVATIFLIPFGLLFSYLDMLPLTVTQSILGFISAYLFLYAIRALYYIFTKKIGLGLGDLELLAFIGSFIGITGWWISLLIGSLLGSVFGIVYIYLYKKNKYIKIPFGPFLALGAILYVLFEENLINLIF